MIAFAITFLLALTAIVAVVCVADSALRGWHSYGALRVELRALRASAHGPAGTVPCPGLRKANPRSARRPNRRTARAATGLRAAA